jgi:hypothetical protein
MILLVCKSCKLQVTQIARLTNCETRKLHNLSYFSLLARLVRLARLALIFLREASPIFHKILARKIAKRDSLSTLAGRSSHPGDAPTLTLELVLLLAMFRYSDDPDMIPDHWLR